MQPYPLALALLSSLSIFIIEVVAFRVGTAKLKKLGVHHGMLGPLPIDTPLPLTIASMCTSHTLPPHLGVDPHGHQVGSYAAHGPEADAAQDPTSGDGSDIEKLEVTKIADVGHASHNVRKEKSFQIDEDAMAQLIGVAILEFGVVLHRHVFSLFLPCPCSYCSAPDVNRACFFSVLIGLTLAVDENFKVLFVVIIFHRMYSPSTITPSTGVH